MLTGCETQHCLGKTTQCTRSIQQTRSSGTRYRVFALLPQFSDQQLLDLCLVQRLLQGGLALHTSEQARQSGMWHYEGQSTMQSPEIRFAILQNLGALSRSHLSLSAEHGRTLRHVSLLDTPLLELQL